MILNNAPRFVRPKKMGAVVVCGRPVTSDTKPFIGINNSSKIVVCQNTANTILVANDILHFDAAHCLHRHRGFCVSKSGPFFAVWERTAPSMRSAPLSPTQRNAFAREPLFALIPALSDAIHDAVYSDASVEHDLTLRCSPAFQNVFPVILASVLGREVWHETPLHAMTGVVQEFAGVLDVLLIDGVPS
jgi:hypothetical protein